MSRHEGVSCDSCLKGNFRGRRYKCLICYDYDLCATCYESGNTTARHTTEHPMQCIITRADFDLYYGGEALNADQPQSFTCPYCSKMGFTEVLLLDHVTAEHADAAAEVVCPICAAVPSGDPNYVTDDFTAHITLEHRASRELDEPMGGIRHVRRIPHPGRGVGGPRTRRTNMHFQAANNAISGLAASTRETMDPIAELLSQLSSVRSRAAAAQSVSSQLQQLEMQLQTTRQQLERLPRRQGEASRPVANGNQAPVAMLDFASAAAGNNNNPSSSAAPSNANSQFLLSKYSDGELSENEKQYLDIERVDRGAFVQELLLSSLAEGLRLDDISSPDSDDDLLGASRLVGVSNTDHEILPVVSLRDHQSCNSSPTAGLHNGSNNDVIIHAPQRDPLTSSEENNGDSVKIDIEAAREREKSTGRPASPPAQNSH